MMVQTKKMPVHMHGGVDQLSPLLLGLLTPPRSSVKPARSLQQQSRPAESQRRPSADPAEQQQQRGRRHQQARSPPRGSSDRHSPFAGAMFSEPPEPRFLPRPPVTWASQGRSLPSSTSTSVSASSLSTSGRDAKQVLVQTCA